MVTQAKRQSGTISTGITGPSNPADGTLSAEGTEGLTNDTYLAGFFGIRFLFHKPPNHNEPR